MRSFSILCAAIAASSLFGQASIAKSTMDAPLLPGIEEYQGVNVTYDCGKPDKNNFVHGMNWPTTVPHIHSTVPLADRLKDIHAIEAAQTANAQRLRASLPGLSVDGAKSTSNCAALLDDMVAREKRLEARFQ